MACSARYQDLDGGMLGSKHGRGPDSNMPDNKILIVEDDRTLLERLKYSLAREGYRVRTATDELQALRWPD